MNIKDLVLPIGMGFLMIVGLNYFFPTKQSEEIESSFLAPREKKEYKPLFLEVDFVDATITDQAQLTDIDTQWARLSFSTYGASLESLDYKHEADGKFSNIRTISPTLDINREDKCFLVALSEKTPFNYSLLSANESEHSHELMYVGSNDECVVQKVFIVDKKSPKIDLLLEIMPKNGKQIRVEPRVLFPSPDMPDIKNTDIISSIVIDQGNLFSKKSINQLELMRGWLQPQLFGSDNRYFIHSLIKDTDHFAQRAYYKLENRSHLISVVEGPTVTDKASWQLSFYVGPKKLESIAAVDTRLEQTLDYSGILSSLAKLLLYILNWLFSWLHNYGLAIIFLTLMIQILLLPLSLRNNEEKFKRQQLEYQRELAYIEQRFKDQPDRLLAERTELIKKKGLPGIGCLIPLLIQLPIFFALSRVLSSSFELYKAPMLWIPDLSLRDPYYILPVLVVLGMLMQDMKGDPQQRMSKIIMAFVFGAITSSFSAGLTLYICMSRIFGFVQSKIMNYFKLV